jgi:hypothetical protein
MLRDWIAVAMALDIGLTDPAQLEEEVEFCDTQFRIGLTAQEKADLVAFLTPVP